MTPEQQSVAIDFLNEQCMTQAGNVRDLAKAMTLLIARLQAVEAKLESLESLAFIQRHMLQPLPDVPLLLLPPPLPTLPNG